ncbi:MAG: ATP-dependent helicase [Opitutaceae bacterium]|nr:ATP-dependent helicase [Opitutaceae bacterium]
MSTSPEQQAAARSQHKRTVILAGPGSGKTTTIIERADFLVRDQLISPADMAFVTFTNNAGRMLRDRLAKKGIEGLGYVGTLHGMMLQLLRQIYPTLTVVDGEIVKERLEAQAKLLAYNGSREGLAMALRGDSSCGRAAERVAAAYRREMLNDRLIDCDSILIVGRDCLKAHHIHSPWQVVFVDEFQDSAMVDKEIYEALDPEWLTVVGDLDQAIYGFRGARPENMSDVWNDPSFERYLLSKNYRCSHLVCSAANAVIRRNINRIPKQTEPAREFSGQITAIRFDREADERVAVAREVLRLINSGSPAESIAVLAPTNALVDALATEVLTVAPVAKVEERWKPRDWSLAVMLSQLVASPENHGLALLFVRERARFEKADTAAAEAQLRELQAKGGTAAEYLDLPSFRLLLSLNANLSRFGISSASCRLMAERIRLWKPASALQLVQALQADPEQRSQAGVNVMTIHGAKGCEWPHVIIAGVDDLEGEEERHRLLFVALTRAERSVYATRCSRRERKVAGRTMVFSRQDDACFRAIEAVSTSARILTGQSVSAG